MCNEDIVRWMQDRQADIHEATMAGNAQEVARLCGVMGTAATDWSTTVHVAVDGVQCSAVKSRDSMYGFRGVRVGEASHPGPRLARRDQDLPNTSEGATQGWRGTLPTVVDSVDRSVVGQRGRLRRRRQSPRGSVPEDVLNALEFDLTRDDSDLAAPGVGVIQWMCLPMMHL